MRVVMLALLLTGCADHTLRAVRGASCRQRPEQAACAAPSWPNEHSSANSDAWLDTHAAQLRTMRPRLLVLNFHNALPEDELRARVQTQIDALAEGTRYHGYSDPDAPAFMRYDLVDLVDLRDVVPPDGWSHSSSSLVPLDAQGVFDMAALFDDTFAERIGRRDPEDDHVLGLCEQFERGFINELWLAVGDETPGREPRPMVECKAHRDEAGARSAGAAVDTAGGSTCARLPACGVTVRIAHLSPLRGAGCDLLVRGWALQGSLRAIPYLARNAKRFFNADLDQRHDAPVANLLALCGGGENPCIRYPTEDSLESVLEAGPRFRIDGYGQGCGSPEFPANATFMWDWQNREQVQARCEHYGLRDGPDGEDLPAPYSYANVEALDERYPDCGGAWQIYWRQSMPGLDNQAFADDGSAMLNWWPLLFF